MKLVNEKVKIGKVWLQFRLEQERLRVEAASAREKIKVELTANGGKTDNSLTVGNMLGMQ